MTKVSNLSQAKKLKTLHIPNGIAITNALSKAPALTKITVKAGNKNYRVKNNLLLNKKGDALLACPGGISKPVVPAGVKKISNLAFSETKIASITIGKDVATIGSYAFWKCKKLKTVSFRSGSQCKTIQASAFEGCSALTSFTSPEKLKTVGKLAFYNCTKLKKVTLNASVKTVAWGAFSDCNKLDEIYIYNKSCKIAKTEDGMRAIPKETTIYSKKNSTAQKYAKTNKNPAKTI